MSSAASEGGRGRCCARRRRAAAAQRAASSRCLGGAARSAASAPRLQPHPPASSRPLPRSRQRHGPLCAGAAGGHPHPEPLAGQWPVLWSGAVPRAGHLQPAGQHQLHLQLSPDVVQALWKHGHTGSLRQLGAGQGWLPGAISQAHAMCPCSTAPRRRCRQRAAAAARDPAHQRHVCAAPAISLQSVCEDGATRMVAR